LDAEVRFGDCDFVSQFLDGPVSARIKRAVDLAQTADAETVAMLFARSIAWMRTVRKLKDPYDDFQAPCAASRAMLEIAVDLTLLHHDRGANPIAKLAAWEESSMFKAAVKAKAFFDRPSSARDPDRATWLSQLAPVTNDGPRIKGLRQQYWPAHKGKHPPRWTGKTLGDDVEAASTHFPRGEFARIYALRYDQLCWHTHGSTLVGVRGVARDEFPRVVMLAFMECAHLGMVGAELTLRELQAWDDIVDAQFQQYNSIRERELKQRLGNRSLFVRADRG
jgi:hypothetical protein